MHSLGPRARRRILFAAVVGVLVAGGVAFHLTRSGGKPSKHPDPALGEDNLGVAYGERPAQVLRRLGRPNEKRGACWIYDARGGKVNGFATLQGAGVDAMKFCFAEDAIGVRAVSRIEWHYQASTYNKVHYPAAWGQPEYIGCNTKHPCVAKQP